MLTKDEMKRKRVHVKLRKNYRLIVGFDSQKRPEFEVGPWEGEISLKVALDNIQKFENADEIRKAAAIPDRPPRVHVRDRLREVEMERRTEEEARIQAIATAAATAAVEKYFDEKGGKKKRTKGRNIRKPERDRAVSEPAVAR